MTKEQQRNMYILYTVVGVIVIILLIIWAVHVHRKNEAAMNSNGSAQGVTMNPTPTPTATAVSPTPKGSPTVASTYGAEVAAHPYRIQFSDNCHGTPGTVDVAKGAVVMLDNRDSTTHTIKADSQTFTIPGYGWVLLHTSVTEDAPVTCDGGGAAMLNVEK